MKIFSRIATIFALAFLIAITVFNFVNGFIGLGILSLAFIVVLVILSWRVGIWHKNTWHEINN